LLANYEKNSKKNLTSLGQVATLANTREIFTAVIVKLFSLQRQVLFAGFLLLITIIQLVNGWISPKIVFMAWQ
jgi:hypothetical protein